MKFSTTKHTLSPSSSEVTQALSASCKEVSIVSTAALTFDVVPGTEGTVTAALVTAAAVDVAEVRTVTTANTFGVGDVLRIAVDGNNVDFTVTSANPITTAAGIRDAINADGTVSAIVTATSDGLVVTLTAAATNTAFTLTAALNNRNINHHIASGERLTFTVPPGSTLRAEGTGTLHVSELL